MKEIAGYPAELLTVPLSIDDRDGADSLGAVELYSVASLDQIVDSQALLRGTPGVEPPYWALIWIGARAIAERVSTVPITGRVLDLGCGLGLSGLAAARSSTEVVFADYAPEALEFVRASIEHNSLTNTTVRHCDFTSDNCDGPYDWILAADVVYDPASYAQLVAFLDRHLRAEGTLLLTETLRADAREVIAELGERGFRDDKQALWITEDGKPERTWLHTLTRQP
jgi:predicted nicotinamide N-methyase